MSGLAAGDLSQIAPRFPILRDQIARELVAVGLALGVAIEPVGGKPAAAWLELPALRDLEAPARSAPPETLPADRPEGFPPSTLQDVRKKRRTEVDYLNGYVSRRGREAGIATPVNDAIVSILKEVEAGARPPHPSNVDRVWDLAAGAAPVATRVAV